MPLLARVRRSLLVLGLVAAAALLVFALVTLPPARVILPNGESGGWSQAAVLPGVFHVHTRRSDGTGTLDEVAAAAARAGLKFVLIADHGDATGAIEPPSYRSGVLCIDGVEVSTDEGHLVALGLETPSPFPLGGEARDVIEDVHRLGGFAVAAHPTSPNPSLRWREWQAPFDGLEWLNGDSEWRDESRWALARTLLHYPFRPAESMASLLDRSGTAFARWDALSRQRPVVGLAGTDAHARIGLRGGGDPYENGASLELPSYETLFRTLSVHVTLDRPPGGDARADAAALLDAVRRGRVHSVVTAIAGPARFEFTASDGHARVTQGERIVPAAAVELRARVNTSDATIVLMKNGHVLREAQNREIVEDVGREAAVYRVEVRWPAGSGANVPWIVGNPIYVGGPLDPRTARTRPEPSASRTLGPVAAWTVERDSASTATLSPAPGEPDRVRFAFTLAGGGHRSPYAAAILPVTGLDTCDRLAFPVSADRPLRASLQLRVPGGTAGGEGERWGRSILIEREPRTVSVFLDDVRPLGPASRIRPPLAAVDSLLIVADTRNLAPGTSAVLSIGTPVCQR